ncbi:MAG: S41 family peptidase [Eubacteriales bacterium]|nr:S41 family peptidase [Eubacteriales bacterium]
MMKRSTAIIACVLVALVTLAGTVLVSVPGTILLMKTYEKQRNPITAGTQSDDLLDYDLLKEVASRVEASSIWAADKETRTKNAAKAIAYGSEDVYAEYYTQEEYSALLEDREGNYVGIGVSVSEASTGEISITDVYDGSPAQGAGLQVGDVIVGVDGEDVRGQSSDDLVDKVRGEEGSEVSITVQRGEGEVTASMTRKAVTQQRTKWYMDDNQIGYIRIASFEGNAATLFKQALEELKAQGARGFILDLRNNPGGMQDIVEPIIDALVPEGTILTMVDKDGNVEDETKSDAACLNMPLVLLVNENSASASELLAGNIKDYGVGTLVGVTTYGKGVAQSYYPLSNGGVLKITADKYLTGAGGCPQGVGIKPDVTVELNQAVYEDYAHRYCNPEYDNQYAVAITELEKLISAASN